ncbi:prephenate dehydrogenase [Convivina intestini]|uniref:Prephenate dehydrogenase n=1 Tax=Convivina intestini TaxID=1505726 RepID=A0A2U1DER0_9LACO|nr:prephenate dehydrogenase/arogenate dehydrogenase family protein [Convivina intestini]PVY86175.1 prephenate dehydrogenase [Convivina intestini]CAH1851396.1 Cyclohexadienyl dehydrogenase [Convivina intestini]CAH1852874.1 Cyclohexadienyl dehydrogenase [Convivina intestini]SDB81255.1 prephenate dehydrogenase [Leuconostocaceae bacterium R-53105]
MNVVIVGLGEMGASLACDLRQSPQIKLIGVDRNAVSLAYARKTGLVDETSQDLATVAAQADLIILATPVDSIEKMIAQLGQLPLKATVIVTDAGSTKRAIMAQARQFLLPKGITFIGGHAMAGSHLAGVQAAKTGMYRQAPYFLMPADEQAASRVGDLKDILAPTGANFITMSVDEHDDLMAVISDNPHVIAFALMNSAVNDLGKSQDFGQYVAGGFKDMTRIAASNPQLWSDILLSNQKAVLNNLTSFRQALDQFQRAIEASDETALLQLISRAQTSRQNLLIKRENND